MTPPDEGRLPPAQEQLPGTGRPSGDGPSERLARAGLTRVLEPGDSRGGQWLRRLGPVALFDRLRGEGPLLPGATAGRMAGLRLRARDARPELDLAAAREAGARFVCPGDAEWPAQLDDLGDARPLGLWVRGTPSLRFWALRSVALVGARACTDYGAHAAGLLGAGLAERGWVVVSGGAYGIDGAAHRATLGAGGATVAVLACGVDSPYPRGHAQLIARIAEQGLVVSELPPGDHPTPSRFVLRNRVIAALTRGTVVVEAAHRSGALSTARAALRLGRAVIGVPGPVTSGLSAGVHELLRGEGHLVADAGDIVELVGGIGELAPAKSGPVLPRDLLPERLGRTLEAVPAGPGGLLERIARGAATSIDETAGHLHELLALGFVERGGENWKLTRQALSGGFPTCDDPVAKVPSCPDHAP
ncbi:MULTISPECIES: DNA-processing protein DprA [Streptomyces]|uniref:Smf/DprA SLOG domain-containing protein n=1 Tax=Streptomyces albidoflavus TaxID=1886 RepID=A0AA37BWA6_9ACTN|nr:DNA-protecting protein DprA [Streptomyces albidoflavus]GHI45346.1 hypothetical protein ScoT_15200 [Streptomyces albidoflavus]